MIVHEATKTVDLTICGCSPAPLQLLRMKMFACSPHRPSLAFDLDILDFVHALHKRTTPNKTALAEALQELLSSHAFLAPTDVCGTHSFAISLLTSHGLSRDCCGNDLKIPLCGMVSWRIKFRTKWQSTSIPVGRTTRLVVHLAIQSPTLWVRRNHRRISSLAAHCVSEGKCGLTVT